MQEYRYAILVAVSRFFELFGVRRPMRYEPPAASGDYERAIHASLENEDSFLSDYLTDDNTPHLGGTPNETALPDSGQI